MFKKSRVLFFNVRHSLSLARESLQRQYLQVEADHVVLDGVAVGELQTAILASVRPDSSVDAAVNLQVVLGVKLLLALITVEGPIVGVDAVVAFQTVPGNFECIQYRGLS